MDDDTDIEDYSPKKVCTCGKKADFHELGLTAAVILFLDVIRVEKDSKHWIRSLSDIMKHIHSTKPLSRTINDFFMNQPSSNEGFYIPRMSRTQTPLCVSEYPKLKQILVDRLPSLFSDIEEKTEDDTICLFEKKYIQVMIELFINGATSEASSIKKEEDKLFLFHTPISKFPFFYEQMNTNSNPFVIYWLFVNMSPYKRGSASAAKVLVNTLLVLRKKEMVKETVEWRRQADWVALLSPSFEQFVEYANVHQLFEEASVCECVKRILSK